MTATERAVEIVHAAARAAADKLATDILAFDVSDQLVITDAFLLASGWRVLRVTYRRLFREPTLVAAQLAAVLAQAAAPRAS